METLVIFLINLPMIYVVESIVLFFRRVLDYPSTVVNTRAL